MTTRRFILQIAGVTAGTCLASAYAQPAAAVSEKDPQAQALGYVTDAKRADKARFPKYAPPQRCAICQLYQGAATAATAPCAIFGGKLVAGPGWCSAYTPRAS
jgi:hypothetical protein